MFREIGGFDRRFAPAYYEDVDLAFSVRAAGRKVYYQPFATVVHFEGQTSGTDEAVGVKRHQVVNQATFAAKWGNALALHRANGIHPELEHDRWAQMRVLVIDACMLTPDHDAGSLRMQAILEILTSLHCKVTFVADNLEYRQPYVSQLQQRGIEVLFHPYTASIADLLSRRGSEFDIVVMSRHYVAVKHLDAVRTFAPKALVVFDTVDLHFLRTERQAELEGSALARAAAHAKRDEELALIRKADVTLVVSPYEQALLAELVPDARVMVLSTIHELLPGGKPFAEREGLVFIGGFQHPPNADAVLWYAREILPRVREALPGAKTYIVGSKVPANVRALAAEDFIVTGYVPDVTLLFHRLPRVDRAAALRRRRQGQDQSRDELRPAGDRDHAVDRGHALDARRGRPRRRRPGGLRGRDRARLPRRGAVAAVGRGRARQHPQALFARCRAQHDHAAHRAGARRRAGAEVRLIRRSGLPR